MKKEEDLKEFDEEELLEFGKQYIGKDTSEYGCVFDSEQQLKEDVEYIKTTGDEMWFEYEDTNINIYKIVN